MEKRRHPRIPYPQFDASIPQGAICRCLTSSCSHRSIGSACGRMGGGHLYPTVTSNLICLDIAIISEENSGKGAIDAAGDNEGMDQREAAMNEYAERLAHDPDGWEEF